MRALRWRWWAIGAAAATAAVWLAAPYVTSAAFLLDLTGSTRWVRRLLPVRASEVTVRDVAVPTRHGVIAARVYRPVTSASRSVVVFPGIHAGGVDEPRLVAFSRRLAGAGAVVLSVPLPDLRVYRITPASTDIVEDATSWMAADRDLAPSGRVSLVGISFAGGLALVAAGRPALSGKLHMVVSLGGHADLPRTMAYLCTGRLNGDTPPPPHDYGVVIILYAAIERVVPTMQVEPLRQALRTFLDASSAESTDQARSAVLFAEAVRMEGALPEPARTLMHRVNTRDVQGLGPVLEPYVEVLGGDPSLSPDRSPAASVPVFLLHGAADNVIPSSETSRVAAYLREHGNAQVRSLVTSFLSHATVQDRGSVGDLWRLIRFWKEVLAVSKD